MARQRPQCQHRLAALVPGRHHRAWPQRPPRAASPSSPRRSRSGRARLPLPCGDRDITAASSRRPDATAIRAHPGGALGRAWRCPSFGLARRLVRPRPRARGDAAWPAADQEPSPRGECLRHLRPDPVPRWGDAELGVVPTTRARARAAPRSRWSAQRTPDPLGASTRPAPPALELHAGAGCCNSPPAHGDARYADYVERYYGRLVREDGSIVRATAPTSSTSTTSTPEDAAAQATAARWKAALDLSAASLRAPAHRARRHWHKQIYPHQMWLDGSYMGATFARSEYGRRRP